MRDLVPYFDSRLSLTRPIFDEFDRALNEIFGKDFFPTGLNRSAYPKMNVYDDNGNLCIDAYIPEINKNKLKVNLEDNIITIEGSYDKESKLEDGKYYCREVSQRAFSRSLQLPDNIDLDKVDAEYKEGMLRVRIPYVIKPETNKKGINIK